MFVHQPLVVYLCVCVSIMCVRGHVVIIIARRMING